MKPYAKMLEEIKVLHAKFVDVPHYFGMLKRIEAENHDLRMRVKALEDRLNERDGRNKDIDPLSQTQGPVGVQTQTDNDMPIA